MRCRQRAGHGMDDETPVRLLGEIAAELHEGGSTVVNNAGIGGVQPPRARWAGNVSHTELRCLDGKLV
jgi:hypothetical protein